MMNMRPVLLLMLIGILFTTFPLIGQDWQSPVGHDIKLSGTFCELRTNHFHHGIDIKSSKGVSGDPVYSIGEGRIHRLRAQAAGYGYSVYILHPEGYVSVYGHLQSFSSRLDSVLRAFQYANEQFEIDIYCDTLNMQVKKGEQIGRMGSTGYSFGPHLHFEIRDAHTEATINPLLFDFPIVDEIKPLLTQVRFDYLTPTGKIYSHKRYDVLPAKNKSRLPVDTVKIPAWRCGLALRTQDKMNNTRNRNGIYQIEIFADTACVYRFKADSVHFHESRGVNMLKDVEAYKKARERWYMAYDQPGNPLREYLIESKDFAWLTPYEKKPQKIKIVVGDVSGNAHSLEFVLLRDSEMVPQKMPFYNYELKYEEPNIVRLDSFEMHCPEGVFYRDQYVHISTASDRSANRLSDVLHMTGEFTPFHQSCTLRVRPNTQDSTWMRRAVILSCGDDGHYNLGGRFTGTAIECPITHFDEYVLHLDTLPPHFEVLRFNSQPRIGDPIQFRIYDEHESKGSAIEVQIRAEIDGQWTLFSHDVKTNTFTGTIPELPAGKHQLQIDYYDHAGNHGNWTKNFEIN